MQQHNKHRTQRLALMPLLLLLGCADDPPIDTNGAPSGCSRDDAFDQDALQADLAWLASVELDGRAPGSPGDAAARDFVEARLSCLGLSTTIQAFTDDAGNDTANVLAIIPGTGLADEVVVVTAHLDHFGGGFLGANDNASGLAGLLAIAHAMRDDVPRRTVVLAAVASEEQGFEGSRYLLAHPPPGIDPDGIVFNVNLDMIGSYRQTGTVYALGALSGTYSKTVVKGLEGAYAGLDISYNWGSAESDNATFCREGIPYLFLWTEDPDCYHDDCDTADRIDYSHLSQIAGLAGAVAAEAASTTTDLAGQVQPGVNVCED